LWGLALTNNKTYSELMKQFTPNSSFIVKFFICLTALLFSCRTEKTGLPEKYLPFANLNSDILVGPGECLLKTFQGTSVNNHFYVSWIFISNTKYFVFQLESSKDGKNFKPYCIKDGASSPTCNTALMLSVRDTTDSNCDKIFFRLRAIPHNYNLDNGYLNGYTSMIEASTILVKRNEKNTKYDLSARPNSTDYVKFADIKK